MWDAAKSGKCVCRRNAEKCATLCEPPLPSHPPPPRSPIPVIRRRRLRLDPPLHDHTSRFERAEGYEYKNRETPITRRWTSTNHAVHGRRREPPKVGGGRRGGGSAEKRALAGWVVGGGRWAKSAGWRRGR